MAAPKKRKRGSIEGAFAWRLVEMLESPAFRVLSLSAHRVMARLEIEMAHHGGKPEENGRLPCTFEHFVAFGVHRHAIAPAIRELATLGFVEITQKGCAGNAGYRQPTLYRLTYRHCGSHKQTTDEWRSITTMDEAEAIAEAARSTRSERAAKTKVQCRKTITGPSAGNHHRKGPFPSAGNHHYRPSAGNHHYLYISRGRGYVRQSRRLTAARPPDAATRPSVAGSPAGRVQPV